MDAAREKAVLDAAPKGLFIGGEWREASSGARFGVEDPATEQTLCEVANGTPDDARAALDAASEAQAEWAAPAPRAPGGRAKGAATARGERGEILAGASGRLNERVDDLALLMPLEMGKPLS